VPVTTTFSSVSGTSFSSPVADVLVVDVDTWVVAGTATVGVDLLPVGLVVLFWAEALLAIKAAASEMTDRYPTATFAIFIRVAFLC
jgi:hypothetical protein